MKWFNSKPGPDSLVVGLRAGKEEDQRLEELRQRFRVKSKGQVLRVALDVLEASMGVTDVTEGMRKSTQVTVDMLREDFGVILPEEAERLAAYRARRRARTRRAREVAGRAAKALADKVGEVGDSSAPDLRTA